MTTQKPTLKLMAEYGCDPLWIDVSPYNVDPADLPISSDLRDSLYAWARRFEGTFNTNDPPKSGFVASKEKEALKIEGAALLDRLKNELGYYFEVTSKMDS